MSCQTTNTDLELFIKNHLRYEDGKIYWINRTGRHEQLNGKEAGSNQNAGYRRVRLMYKDYLTHRVIFFMHHGYWPNQVDHINRDRSDNRIENLRNCDIQQNRMNSSHRTDASKYGRNVSWAKKMGKYRVRLNYKGQAITLGYFKDLEFAQLLAKEAREKYFGEWAYDY